MRPSDIVPKAALAAWAPAHDGRAGSASERILILAPTSNDARLSRDFLVAAGFAAAVCDDLATLCAEAAGECGALLVAEEALCEENIDLMIDQLGRQPSWSDIPVAIIIGGSEQGESRRHHLARFKLGGNIILIERPFRPGTLISTFEVALRSRRRQYQVRDLLEERESVLSRIRQAQESLAQQAAALRDADRRKDEFLAMLAHELRNPLASVANAATLLQLADDGENRSWAAGVIVRQTAQLARLIDDLLDVSRITSGKIRLRREMVDAAILIDRACESAQPLIDERRHELRRHFSRGVLWIEADPTRIEQIILNLLTNAAKYTGEDGLIEVAACREGAEILITIRDNGIGIAPAQLPGMFELFAQGERSIARSEGGLGIGLTIVKKLVEMHGGKVEAESAGTNRGTAFTVRLPAAGTPAGKPNNNRPPATEGAIGIGVLVVDDNIDTAEGLARLLRGAGHRVLVAYDGSRALEIAREQKLDAVLLDLGLPEMDGYETAARLRAETSCADCLLVAVSGYAQEEDRRRSRAAGFDHHLAKPIDFAELKRLLAGKVQAESSRP
ncbi:MAG: hybrid sensor histidine kinase/response regulator [Verrucomicrobiales bacterium]